MKITIALLVSRFLYYVALSVLFGGALFPFYGVESARDKELVSQWLRMPLFAAALLTLVSGFFWFPATQAIDFGGVWILRLVAGAGLSLVLLGRVTKWRLCAALFGSLVLLASVVWTGHAGSDTGATARPHLLATLFHFVAAGAWVGALFVFARLGLAAVRQVSDEELHMFHHALARFSGIGPVIVATLLLSGIFLIGLQSVSSIYVAAYNRVLLAKLIMFGAMLLLAAANRYRLTPRLSLALESRSGLENAVGALQWSLLAETVLAVLVLAAVAWLGAVPPR